MITNLFLALILLFLSCFPQNKPKNGQKLLVTDGLELIQISAHCWQHISYIDIPDYGKFPCNGVVYVSGGEAVILDTPLSDSLSVALINWVETELNAKVTGLVVNHFHEDCTAGLKVFQDRNITTYSSQKTCQLSKKQQEPCATQLFKTSEKIKVGKQKVVNQFFGEGHTKDNIVTWIPEDSVLFGGCLIKESGAGKGNLADANTKAWPQTVQKIKQAYPQAKIIVPGHGQPGGQELLDYTIKLFSK